MGAIKISVGKIVEMILSSGDIDSRFKDDAAMHKGSAAHRKIQKEAQADKSIQYTKEVSLKYETTVNEIPVLVRGRADGIIAEHHDDTSPHITIDEIKTTTLPLEYIFKQQEMHLSQGKCYGFMYLQTLENPPGFIDIQLTYYQLESGETKRFKSRFTAEGLKFFFFDLLHKYSLWLKHERDWKSTRNESIKQNNFPFENFRKGQRELAAAVYRTISAGKKLYASAPTGIGKTISTVFPAIKAMGEEKSDKIFYLTAKTVARQAPEDALRLMATSGFRIKSMTLRAKEKICLNHEQKCACNPDACPFARGHFDRVNDAVWDIINNIDLISPHVTMEYAAKHRVCPHEFSLDTALWCDIIIGDYNHVFDPVVYLRRFFAPGFERDYVFLIDEAHNLAERVRDMYSAVLHKAAFGQIRSRLKDKDMFSTNLRKVSKEMNGFMIKLRKENEKSFAKREKNTELSELAERSLPIFGDWLAANKNSSHELFEDIMNLYFELRHFAFINEIYDSHYTTITEIYRSEVSITLFCLDPSALIADGLARAKSSVLFSATLTPLKYFHEILGGANDDNAVSLPSPFDPLKLDLTAHCRVSTKYVDRESSYSPIAEIIYAAISRTKGNYMVFFPSYEYMRKVYEVFNESYPEINTLLQQSGMSEDERAEFLEAFDGNNAETLVSFTVLGGIFSEGIDLKGDRLIGSIIVSVGIPKISLRQDLIKNYFDEKNNQGYDFAYVFPGMNKVLQAAGRVIRTESDTGVVLLIDSRYSMQKYKNLFPAHWSHIKFR